LGYFLFAAWLIILGWVLIKLPFVRKTGLAPRWICLLFAAKVGGGMLYGWLTQADPSTDTWRYHADGLLEYQLLLDDPVNYLSNLFQSGYADGYGGLLRPHDSYWNDLHANLMIKIVSLMDIFSGGRYYVNVVLYNFGVFVGCAALFRFGKQLLKAPALIMVVAVFCLPSVWLYGSALHKEGILLACMGFLLYGFHAWLDTRHTRYWLLILPSLLLIFLFRPYMIAAMIPPLMAFCWTRRFPAHSLPVVYGVNILIAAVLFFGLPRVIPSLDFPAAVAQKQAAFLALGTAHTSLPAEVLQPTPGSFLRQLPAALQHVLLRPWVTDYRLSPWLIPHILEWGACWGLVLLGCWFRKRDASPGRPFVWMLVTFVALVWVFIGYTVPVLGAIIRYRALYLPLLLAPLLAQTDWKSMAARLNIVK